MKKHRTETRCAIVLTTVVLLLAAGWMPAAEPVKLWEEDVQIPTYLIGPPNLNPMFYNGRVYQGAQGRVYPYPLLDDMTHEKEMRTHRLVYLENEFIKVGLLPGAAGGGRIFNAVDKTNGFDFIYRQTVIKPALIGVLGAWISGGVEWNVPHHHRTSTYLPANYRLEENPDGSKTVWMGEIELRHRMKWMVGVTLRPGSSHLEVKGRLANRTPLVQSFLFFANLAVHADSSYQIIFPPSLVWGTGHGKHDFTTWPLASGENVLGHEGYRVGEDLSWWKAHPSPISVFALNCKEDFMAGYNHGKRAGLVHVADHHIVPGKKLWEWGPGDAGRMWDYILTDSDGPYIEIMIGAYSDNQPDYSWIQPYETKEFTYTWWPLREIGGVKNANLDAAVNLEVTGGGRALVGFNASSVRKGAREVLKAGSKVLLDERIDLGPASPFRREVRLPAGVREEDLVAALYDSDGRELISYQKKPKENIPEPEPVTPPPAPAEIKTIEELYFAGLRLEQFHNAAIDPDPYYLEALRRDPGDYRTNTALGILYIKRGMFEQAAEHLQRSVKRITSQHTRPRDGEALFYLGVIQRLLGNLPAAREAFFEASWSSAFYAASFNELARIASLQGDRQAALEYLDRSLSVNAGNNTARCLEAALHRREGKLDDAMRMAAAVQEDDPLDFWAANELVLASRAQGNAQEEKNRLQALTGRMHGSLQSFLELAVSYGDCELLDEAIEVLQRYLALDTGAWRAYNAGGVTDAPSLTDGSKAMAWYYLGYYYQQKGDRSRAAEFYRSAAAQPTDLVFPFRLESYAVLESALQNNPQDARAAYYLGNLNFDWQPDKAIGYWEKSRELDGSFPIVHRNLGLAYSRVRNDLAAGIVSLEKAVSLAPDDPEPLDELDQLYEASGVAPEKRLAQLEAHQPAVNRLDGLLASEIELYVRLGRFDRGIELLEGNTFSVWEGRGEIHDVWVDALLARGENYLRQGRNKEALADFERALTYPVNLAVGRPREGGREVEVDYFIGLAREALGDKKAARGFYQKSVSLELPRRLGSELAYHQGRAWAKLGDKERAGRIFEQLVETGQSRLSDGQGPDYFAKFGERQAESLRQADAHYLIGLGHLGLGRTEEARQEFQKALGLNINHRGAAAMLTGR